MPQYLRSLRQSRWTPPKWLNSVSGEIQADALKDLNTTDNKLSVYKVEFIPDIRRITVALAATRDNFQNVDYAIFSDTGFRDLGIEIVQNAGQTPDRQVNDLHHDISNLTVSQTSGLATIISVGAIERCLQKDIRSQMQLAIQSGELDSSAMNDKLLSQLR